MSGFTVDLFFIIFSSVENCLGSFAEKILIGNILREFILIR